MQAKTPAKSLEASLRAEETKRRKREGIVIAVAALMVAALIFFEVQSPDISLENSLGSNIVFFLVINVNIILLVLLVFLVVRNLVKLVFERKRRMLGFFAVFCALKDLACEKLESAIPRYAAARMVRWQLGRRDQHSKDVVEVPTTRVADVHRAVRANRQAVRRAASVTELRHRAIG